MPENGHEAAQTTLAGDVTENTDPNEDGDAGVERGECRRCGEEVRLDGEAGVERWGSPICFDCMDDPVRFVARCTNQLCDWEATEEGTEFQRGAIERSVRRQANNHESEKRVFEDDHTHATTVEEVDT